MNRWVRLLKSRLWTFPCIAIATQPTPCWRRGRRHKFFQRGFKENSSSSGDYLQVYMRPIAQTPWFSPLLLATILTLLYTPFFLWSERRRAARNPQKAPPWAPERRLEVRRWKMEQTCLENLESVLQHGIIDHKRLWAWQPISLDNGNWKYSTNTKHLLVIKPV